MSDCIGLSVILLCVACGFFGLARLSRPRAEISIEEYEKRVRESPSLLSAGITGLQKILEPGARVSIEAQEELREGRYNKGQAVGDGDEAGTNSNSASADNKKDA